MIKAKSALDIWWEIAGIFGGGMLGLFLLALFRARLRTWQGIIAIIASVIVIVWGVFFDQALNWLEAARGMDVTALRAYECKIDGILVGALGTAIMLIIAGLFSLTNKKTVDSGNRVSTRGTSPADSLIDKPVVDDSKRE